ncbi:MAG: hypothetical protein N3F66_13675, partial [Spirochaetes bacterium]|nr:hypothetical protein [Spirochaetota bacterium]
LGSSGMDAVACWVVCLAVIAMDGVVKHAVEGFMFREGSQGKRKKKIHTVLVMHEATGVIGKW